MSPKPRLVLLVIASVLVGIALVGAYAAGAWGAAGPKPEKKGLHFAGVSSAGSLLLGDKDVTGAGHTIGSGVYTVGFKGVVDNCAPTATLSGAAGEVSVAKTGPQQLTVSTYNSVALATDAAFFVQLAC